MGLSRGDLFDMAKSMLSEPGGPTDEQLLALLWNTLAWGTIHKRAGRKRIRAVASDTARALKALRDGVALASSDPAGAYEVMYPRLQGVRGPRKTRHTAIPELGPAFFTKVLYFAGEGRVDHPCAILDKRVAVALRGHCQWAALGNNYWEPDTYQRYVDLLGAWADDASAQLGRQVGRDEFERFLFGR